MDPNLTYHVVVNAPINATLIPEPSNPIKDWLPAVVSIIVVILGALATYYVNNRIENNKRQFELKQQVYFKGLEIVSETYLLLSRVNDLFEVAKVPKDQLPDKYKEALERVKAALPTQQGKEFEELAKKYSNNNILMYILLAKIGTIGNETVKKCFDDIYNFVLSTPFDEVEKKWPEYEEIIEKFCRAVREDLNNQSKWYQFWK